MRLWIRIKEHAKRDQTSSQRFLQIWSHCTTFFSTNLPQRKKIQQVSLKYEKVSFSAAAATAAVKGFLGESKITQSGLISCQILSLSMGPRYGLQRLLYNKIC
jgi:hypothetical protein